MRFFLEGATCVGVFMKAPKFECAGRESGCSRDAAARLDRKIIQVSAPALPFSDSELLVPRPGCLRVDIGSEAVRELLRNSENEA